MEKTMPSFRHGCVAFGVLSLCAVLLAGAIVIGSLHIVSTLHIPEDLQLPTIAEPSFGVNLDWAHLDEDALRRTLDAIEELRPEAWLRLRFHWVEMEPAPGQFDWSLSDRLMRELEGRPFSIIAVIETSPNWARAEMDQEHPFAPPVERRDFGRFVSEFSGRYGHHIEAYQIWDQPNIYPHWGNRLVDPAGYVALLREGAIQVRHADPHAWVLAGGLAPNIEAGGRNMSDIGYLQAMYWAGAAEWMDALAAKPYGLRDGPSDRPDLTQLNFQRLALLRKVMEDAGAGTIPIWGVEFGWNSLPADWDGEPSPWGVTADEEQQIAWTKDAVQLVRREWPWLGPLLWAEWQPFASSSDPRWGFSLLDQHDRERAMLSAYRQWPEGSPLAGPGRHTFVSPAVSYEGKWRLSEAGADVGNDGDTMWIHFHGTALDLTVRRGLFWAYFVISVDGQPANRLPQDESGVSYLVLYDPLLAQETVTVASGLSDGPHVAQLTAHGGWDQWALASFTVRRDGADRGTLPAAGTLAAGILGVAGILWLSIRREHNLALSWLGNTWLKITDWWRERPLDMRLLLVLLFGAGFFFAPSDPLTLLCGVAVAASVALWPAGGLVLTAGVIPFFIQPPVLFGRSVPAVELLIWLTMISWAINAWARGRLWDDIAGTWGGRTWLDGGVLGLLVAGGLSVLAASHMGIAAFEWRRVILAPVLFYLLWRLISQRDIGLQWKWRGVELLVAAGLLVALIGIFQWVRSENLITAEGVTRIRSVYGSPNNLSLYLERIIPLTLAMALFGSGPRRRVSFAAVSLILLAALYLTFSRGAWLLGLPVAILSMGLARGGRWRWVALILVIVVALALIPLAGTERLQSLFDLESGTTFFRLKLWQGAWNMARDHIWLGVGPDNFLYEYRTRYVLPLAWEDLNLSHPHNIVLDVLTRMGVVGLLPMVVMIVGVIRQLWRRARESDDPNARALFLGLIGSMAGFLAHGLIDNSFFLMDLALVFMLTAGLAATWPMNRTDDHYKVT